ncbi:MAG: hypothetical protein WD601_12940, partial [Pseudohongiellaceae bacterium]
YLLYMLGLVIGITGIIGVVMAYIYRDDAPPWLKSHYDFQIRTFWMGAVFMVAGVILFNVGIGVFILFFWLIWLIMRCIKGMKILDQRKAHPDTGSWMF